MKDKEEYLPWSKDSLKVEATEALKRGEASKVDLKACFDISDKTKQSELLKDIAAIANTAHHYHKNYGLIIFGATEDEGLTYTEFSDNADKLQGTIDQIIENNIGPFIHTRLYIYDDGESKRWGVLLVHPSNNVPHVFLKNAAAYNKGDVFVRINTTTAKARPEDYSRFSAQNIDVRISPLRDMVHDLQAKVTSIEKIKPRKIASAKNKKAVKDDDAIFEHADESLQAIVESRLSKEEDILASKLLAEVDTVTKELMDVIPWGITSLEKEVVKELLGTIEKKCETLWSVLTTISYKDEKGVYDDLVARSLKLLAQQSMMPEQVSYNEMGKSIHLYPLIVALYICIICATQRRRTRLIQKILNLKIDRRSKYEEPFPISFLLFTARSGDEVFQPMRDDYPDRRWCDALASYSKPAVEKIIAQEINDPFLDIEVAFNQGELILCLSPIGVIDTATNRPVHSHPSSGSYLYSSISIPILTKFLREEKSWIEQIFKKPLKEVLNTFDAKAKELASSRCWADGFVDGALQAAYPEDNVDKK